MADGTGIWSTLVGELPKWTGLASSNGPFFFGVFLVIVSLFVMLRADNKHMGIFYAVSGIIFMGLATFSFIETKSAEKIYPYRITLTDLPKNAEIHLPLTAPRMYRDNILTSMTGSSVQVAILSDRKLDSSSRFAVHLFIPVKDDEGNDTPHKQGVGKLAIPFKGQALSIYTLTQVVHSDFVFEEDGDASPPLQYEFVEEGLQNTFLGSTIFDTLGSMVIGSAFAEGTDTLPSDTVAYGSPIPPLVVYYRKRADGEAIVDVLDSTPARSVVKGSDLEEGTNAIWIGKDVPAQIIDDIARGMLDKQIPLRSISHFGNPDSKTNIVQIGTSTRSSKNSLVTETMVAEFVEQHHRQQTANQQEQKAIAEQVERVEENINRTLKKFEY